MSRTATTTDHAEIRRWLDAHGGHPAIASRTAVGMSPAPLRIDFPGYTDAEFLEPISWEEFFARFEAERLAFVHGVDEAETTEPPFFAFVPRDGAGASQAGGTT
jgi:hypothetical protein